MMFAQWEWAILLILFVFLLIAELVSVRRSIRRARNEAPGTVQSPPPPRNAER